MSSINLINILERLGACYRKPEDVRWAEHAMSLPPDQAWVALIDRAPGDAWWLLERIDPEFCEELAEPWRRYALRAAAWAMLPVDASHSAYLLKAADTEKFDRRTAVGAAEAARTAANAVWTAAWAAETGGAAVNAAGAAVNAVWTAAWAAETAEAAVNAARTAWTAAWAAETGGAAVNAARTAWTAAWAADTAAEAAAWEAPGEAANAAETAAEAAEAVAKQQLWEATPRVVEAWQRWLAGGRVMRDMVETEWGIELRS